MKKSAKDILVFTKLGYRVYRLLSNKKVNAKTRKHLKEKVPIHKYLQSVHRKRQNSVGKTGHLWCLQPKN